jgi:hypothetical protein
MADDEFRFPTFKPCPTPGGSTIVIGTRLGEGDLYEKLIEEKKWPSSWPGDVYTSTSNIMFDSPVVARNGSTFTITYSYDTIDAKPPIPDDKLEDIVDSLVRERYPNYRP